MSEGWSEKHPKVKIEEQRETRRKEEKRHQKEEAQLNFFFFFLFVADLGSLLGQALPVANGRSKSVLQICHLQGQLLDQLVLLR